MEERKGHIGDCSMDRGYSSGGSWAEWGTNRLWTFAFAHTTMAIPLNSVYIYIARFVI